MPQRNREPSNRAALCVSGMLPTGKLPLELLSSLLGRLTRRDPRVLLGPGIGLDCTVIDFGDRLLVAKTDPITFTADRIGWYAVHVNANDVATTGARPRWFLCTVLLPENGARPELIESIFEEIEQACAQVGAELVGGHTEVTAGLERPVLSGTMLGEVAPDRLITPRGARPGDRVLLTKGVPIEGGSILAREFADRLGKLPADVVERASNYLVEPGISVVREAMAAVEAGGVSAMHDPTEGGLAAALWELADAAGVRLEIDLEAVPVLPEGAALCAHLGLEPLDTIASGALLLTVTPGRAQLVASAVAAQGVAVSDIGEVVTGNGVAMRSKSGPRVLPRPARDALAALYD